MVPESRAGVVTAKRMQNGHGGPQVAPSDPNACANRQAAQGAGLRKCVRYQST